MGNSKSQTSNAEVINTRVIEITESAAKMMLEQNPDKGISKRTEERKIPSVYLPEVPTPHQQAYREDGNYVDDDLFKEFQKQEVLNKSQLFQIRRRIISILQPIAIGRPKLEKLPVTDEEKRLLTCFESNKHAILKCHTEVLDFTKVMRERIEEMVKQKAEQESKSSK